MQKNKHILCIYIICFAAMIALFLGALTAVYMIPNEKIEWHTEYSMYTLSEIEENWESFGNLFGLHSQPGMMDNSSDRVMFSKAYVQDESMSALEAALYMNGYTRYWHGYQVFLRPLLVFYQIHQIRYLSMTAFFILLFWTLSALWRRLGKLEAAAFLLSMISAHLVVIPMSMQYMAVFMVAMLAALVVLYRYPFARRENLPLFFMVVGMLINFLDLLTTPIVTLGVPLLLCLCLDNRDGMSVKRAAATVLSSSAAWTAGYGLCWAAKWGIASLVLGKGQWENVWSKVQYWAIDGEKTAGRIEAAALNFRDFFLSQGIRTMVFPLAFLLVLGVLAIVCGRKEKGAVVSLGAMLAVSLYPYIWYILLAEHSWQHHWFTYRAQVVALFGLYLAVAALIDRVKLCTLTQRKNGRTLKNHI